MNKLTYLVLATCGVCGFAIWMKGLQMFDISHQATGFIFVVSTLLWIIMKTYRLIRAIDKEMEATRR